MKMIKKIKNKFRINIKSKFFVLGFIFLVLVGVGLFSSGRKAQAETEYEACIRRGPILGGLGHCSKLPGSPSNPTTVQISPYDQCIAFGPVAGSYAQCNGQEGQNGRALPPVNEAAKASTEAKTEFQKKIAEKTCGFGVLTGGGSVAGCMVQVFYFFAFVIPSYLLWLTAYFFNVMISVSLSGDLFRSAFVLTAWGVVRDLSNLFFILILLYIAIQIILGIGGTDVKKMIARVIILALLINFSMFMTEVVIDTSNILALIFYNKLDVNTGTKNADGTITPRPYAKVTANDKDVAGGMVSAFNPTSTLGKPFFNEARKTWNPDGTPGTPENEVPAGTLMAILWLTGIVLYFAIYTLFVSGLSFVGRLIELWVLIIFSPFAFMSFSIPVLSGIEYLGWKSWLSRLLKVAFMAPVFMFFLYFIFLLIQSNPYKDIVSQSPVGEDDAAGVIKMLLKILLPTMLILILLLKATSFAKKGSGQVGEAIIKGGTALAGVATGVALGVASGGASLAIGGVGGALANKSASLASRMGTNKYGAALGMNKLASGLTGLGAYAQSSSFDVRGTRLGKGFASATGLDIGEAQKGGIAQRRKEKVEKRRARAEMLNVREDEPLKQALNKTEADLQSLLSANVEVMEALDKAIEKKRQEASDAERKLKAAKTPGEIDSAKTDLQDKNTQLRLAKENKKDFREGKDYMMTNSAGVNSIETGTGKDMDKMEEEKKDAARAVKSESRRRKVLFAERTGERGGAANREAKHKIIMESKIDSKGETH